MFKGSYNFYRTIALHYNLNEQTYDIDYGLMCSWKVLNTVVNNINMQILSHSKCQYTPYHNEYDTCFVRLVFSLK